MSVVGDVGSVLIAGGRVVDPSQGLDEVSDVLVRDGVVEAIGEGIAAESADVVVRADGLLVTAGFVDLHVHFGEPGEESAETIESGANAAARGGFTTVHLLPDTDPPLDDASLVRFVRARARQGCGVRVKPLGAATRGRDGTELTEFAALLESGVSAFTDAPRSIENAATMRRALEIAKDLGTVIVQQPMDKDLAGSGVMHEGEVSIRLGLHGIPRIAEATQAARDAALAHATGGRVHFAMVSNAETVEVVRQAKQRGAPVTAGVSVEHLTCTHEMVAGDGLAYRTQAKLLPPLCEERDRLALIEGLRDGTIDAVTSGHRPCSASSKDSLFDSAASGVAGLESAFGVLVTELAERGELTMGEVVSKLTVGPSAVFAGRHGEAGTLEVGRRADLCLHAIGGDWVFDAEACASRSGNSLWDGRRLRARTVATAVGGRAVYVDRGWAWSGGGEGVMRWAGEAATLEV